VSQLTQWNYADVHGRGWCYACGRFSALAFMAPEKGICENCDLQKLINRQGESERGRV
jgi:hypothetical protein